MCEDFAYPKCSYCEDTVEYKVNDCCVSYECKCNPSKCFKMASPPCPIGSTRVIVEQDSCCGVAKCVLLQKGTMTSDILGSASINAPSTKITLNSGLYDPTFGTNGLKSSISSDSLSNANAHSNEDLSLEIYHNNKACFDTSGAEREYGQTWVENDKACKICVCYEEGVVKWVLKSSLKNQTIKLQS